ncbi:hypothetical protein [Tenacibaculum piscium]|uniref:hypothetical protein n=2 Tax=Tenacibaculum piscium TaxID=1458515 RepID=UPI001F333F2E|nr:hypothetical protein [Tenacibaculum piscium]
MKKLLIILVFLTSNATLLSQSTKVDKVAISVRAFDFIVKDLQNCDSLKGRYKELQFKVDDFSKSNLKLLKRNDSLQELEKLHLIKINNLNKDILKVKKRPKLSALEIILITTSAFAVGLAL